MVPQIYAANLSAGELDFLASLENILGKNGLITGPAAALVYGTDSSHIKLGQPLAVTLPATRAQVLDVFSLCAAAKIPLVCRGSGTGLSGGAVPSAGSVVLGFSRLNQLGPINKINHRVKVEPGVLNDQVSLHGASADLHFAPDPSSQSIATIGGNIAENAGGPHCLRHGVTLQHVLGVDWIDSSGKIRQSSRSLFFERGFSLTALLCGSEGTLGLLQAADLNLVPNPQSVITILAVFSHLKNATSSVVSLLGAGLMPVACEMVDQPMLIAVEAAFGFGFPTDVEAAMILELAGRPQEVQEDAERARQILMDGGAREIRQAANETERLELWKCRKKAFGAVGRLAPSYVTMDVVVPLGQLPDLVQEIQVIKKECGVDIATAFHAGDGNLHPGVHYDDHDEEDTRRAHQAADRIIAAALKRGGSCTGEHGVGLEKIHVLPWQMDEQCARLHHLIKHVFDPESIFNPGKLLPPVDADFRSVKGPPGDVVFQWSSMTVTAPADTSLALIQSQALAQGLWIPVGMPLVGDPTLGDLTGNLLCGPALLSENHARPYLLELWAETGDGRHFCTGAPVFKNAAGYNLAQGLCGSGTDFVKKVGMTYQLRPVAEAVRVWRVKDCSREVTSSLLELLTMESGGPGSPLIIKNGSELLVVVSGRRRSWDLDVWMERLENLLPGLDVSLVKDVDLAGNAQVLPMLNLPDWTQGKVAWTSVVPTAENRKSLNSAAIHGTEYWIWQAEPRLFWVPELIKNCGAWTDENHWYLDTLISAGKFTAIPQSGPGVPVDLLHRLEKVFNPPGADNLVEPGHE